MFGNMVRRMANGLLLSSALSAGNLIVPKKVIFYRGLFSEDSVQTELGPRVWFGVAPRFWENHVDLLITTDLFRGLPMMEEHSSQIIDDSWSALRKLLVPEVPVKSSGSNVLTIHVRAGDVFGPRKPAAYGQPPLAYYRLIIDARDWQRVVLVYQDMSNPVVQGLIDFCQSKNLPLTIQSRNLPEDLTTLLGAENIVAGRGSFIPAIAGLSPHCKTVYYFEDKMNVIPSVPGVQKIKVSDRVGVYRRSVLSKNWENTESQRDLMMTYPVASLTIETP